MNSGIYEIKNKINGKRYIGSAVDLKRRKRQHYYDLNHNKHTTSKLQNAWNKYGADAFEFNILHYVYDVMLIAFEQACLDSYWNEGLYNTNSIAGSQLGFKHSEESKIKMRESRKKQIITDETRRKIGDAHRGKIISPATRKKMSEKVFTEAHRKKMSEVAKGRTHSEETRKKMSEAAKGRIPPSQKGKIPWNKGKSKNNT